VLVGDHDPNLRRALAAIFRRKGYRVRTYKSAEELVSRVWECRGDLDAPEHVVVGIAHCGQTVLDDLSALAEATGLPPTTVLVPDGETGLADTARLSGVSWVVDRSRALTVLPKTVPEATSFPWDENE
jgi:hypothetical protein